MDVLFPAMRDFAQRLLAAEAASKRSTDEHSDTAVRVCEKLRISLTRFAGPDGFTSLLKRALALARVEIPSLETVKIKPDGSLDGLESPAFKATDGSPGAAVVITAHLLGLLVTFIGKPLTLRLIRETWPDGSFGE